MKEINDIFGKKEFDEPKLKENKEVREFSDYEYKNILKEQKHIVDSVSLESLRIMNNELIKDALDKKQGLTEDEKKKIREAHPDWPDSIIDAIRSWKEYEIYDKAGLVYAKINGKDCLIRSDIDMNQKDKEFGLTNKERMERGLPPLDKNDNPIELHHIGQKPDSPLAELTQEEHRGKGNDGVLHDKTKESEIDRDEFTHERIKHWEKRAENI